MIVEVKSVCGYSEFIKRYIYDENSFYIDRDCHILSLAGMAQSQYDGAPVNRSANETSTDNVEVRRNKYPRSDNDWENFDVLHINRLPSAANFMGYPTKELALQGDKSQSPYFQSLNGTWKFHFVPRSDERPMDFFQKGYDVSGWDDIKVPSNWELQGFGYPFM